MALTTASEIRASIPNGNLLDAAVVTSLLNAADAAAKSWMRRVIESGNYTERLQAARVGEDMFIAEFPVTAVTSVSVAGSTALDVWNAGAVRATVSVKEDAVVLREFYGGSWTTTNLTFASNATLSSLVTAIQAVSGGRWDAELSTEVAGTEPSEEIGVLSGPVDVSESKPLSLYLLDETPPTDWDFETGAFQFTECGTREGETVLVKYTGGYTTVPSDISRGVALLAAELYAQDQTDIASGLKRVKLGDYEAERFENMAAVLSPSVQKLLGPYRRMLA
jgi:hypothetical protein